MKNSLTFEGVDGSVEAIVHLSTQRRHRRPAAESLNCKRVNYGAFWTGVRKAPFGVARIPLPLPKQCILFEKPVALVS